MGDDVPQRVFSVKRFFAGFEEKIPTHWALREIPRADYGEH
jgi:hypothetical protein